MAFGEMENVGCYWTHIHYIYHRSMIEYNVMSHYRACVYFQCVYIIMYDLMVTGCGDDTEERRHDCYSMGGKYPVLRHSVQHCSTQHGKGGPGILEIILQYFYDWSTH